MENRYEIIELPNFRTATLSINIPIGSAFEEVHGLNTVTFESMERQTEKWNEDELAELMDHSGITGGFYPGRTNTSLTLRGPPKNIERMIQIATEFFSAPRFTEEVLSTIVEKQKSVLSHIRSSPESILRNYLRWTASHGDDPVTKHPYGKEEVLDQLTESHLERWFAEILKMRPTLVLSAPQGEGSPHREALEDLAGVFGEEEQQKKACFPSDRKFHKAVERPVMPASNTYIGVNLRTPPPVPETFSTLVFRALVGAGVSTRLFKVIREERNLSYAPGIHRSVFPGGGFMTAMMDVRPERAPEALKVTLDILSSTIHDRIPEDEMRRAKKMTWSSFAFVKDTSKALTQFIVDRMSLGQEYDLSMLKKRIDETFESDWQGELQRYWTPQNLSFAASGEDLTVGDVWNELVEEMF